jgi:hypothetical protein
MILSKDGTFAEFVEIRGKFPLLLLHMPLNYYFKK